MLTRYFLIILVSLALTNCKSIQKKKMKQIILLHHSTGNTVWLGKTNRYLYKISQKGDVQKFFGKYNKKHKTDYIISDLAFPKQSPYGWRNYPYDYYNIWVKNAGDRPYMEEPTLEILTKKYDIIIFKHCFPVSLIIEDTGIPNIDSDEKRVENYKLQYDTLKKKMHEFPNNKFIVWTPAVLVKNQTNEEQAKRAHDFYKWIVDSWDEKGDNIYIWDFYKYETEVGLYLKKEYAAGSNDSHPNTEFASRLTPLFCHFIIDCINNDIE